MMQVFLGTAEDLRPISLTRAQRRAAISALMQRTAKGSEADLPPAERRQVIDLRACASALAAGGTVQHAAAWSRWEWLAFVSGWLAVASGAFLLLLLVLDWVGV